MITPRYSRVLRTVRLIIAVCLASFPALAQYGGGTGEPSAPYLIYTAEQMNEIGAEPNDWDNHFKLMADIDLSVYTGKDFNVIGIDFENAFTGVFDGNGHVISNFSYESTAGDGKPVGLFRFVIGQIKDLRLVAPDVRAPRSLDVGALVGRVRSGGTVTGCSVEGGTVLGRGDVGGLVGDNADFVFDSGTISNCTSSATVTGDDDEVGGLVGRSGIVSNCTSTAIVKGDRFVGGLAGTGTGGPITDCTSAAIVTGEYLVGGLVGEGGPIINCSSESVVTGDDSVGGLVGWGETLMNCASSGEVSGNTRIGGLAGRCGKINNCYTAANVQGSEVIGGLVGDNDGAVFNCYAQAGISGSDFVGGLVGRNAGGVIINCYSTSGVMGTTNFGGLVGSNEGGLVHASFWDIQSSRQSSSDGGMGMTTAEMQIAETFVGWDQDPVWTLDEGADYPRLWWQNMPGEAITTPPDYEFLAGDGTQGDPYLIYTAEHLNMIGLFPSEWDKHFKLMADIDLGVYGRTDYSIIGRNWACPFTGVFDGNAHTISNFSYTSRNTSNAGLFGCVADPNAVIKNVRVVNPNVNVGSTEDNIGALVGLLEAGTITDCNVEGGTVSGGGQVGGLIGMSHGVISGCRSSAAVRAAGIIEIAGGLIGRHRGTLISDCGSSGSVVSDGPAGGLVGCTQPLEWGRDNLIENCHATGNVKGQDVAGGLVGEIGPLIGPFGSMIRNCSATGNVTVTREGPVSSGEPTAGGLVGRNRASTIARCYSTGSVSGVRILGGLVGSNEGDWGGGSKIIDCYSLGSVTGTGTVDNLGGTGEVGGLVGNNDGGCIITSSYSAGSVSGYENVGGLVGANHRHGGGIVHDNCFWDIETSGLLNMCGKQADDATGCDDSHGKTTKEMQAAGTFLQAAWDFANETANGTEDIWWILEGQDYPRLWWEIGN